MSKVTHQGSGRVGFPTGSVCEFTAGAFSSGRIILISPLPTAFSQRQQHGDLELVLLNGWCYGRTNKRKVIVSICSVRCFPNLEPQCATFSEGSSRGNTELSGHVSGLLAK